ncbi:hydrolase 1, exosortase A system-associated [uncultured Massilia sp.]|uniref:hydrolase 1, exosortase A system-associated n=1 Tax=uncultured Massilia sp. TaxID=169973 RepID=UPI0025EB66AF|nr:hydrolase 1, exosortase A system-associated [uncultured Massilia sp.]
MSIDERALTFDCGGDRLVGILALPAQAPPHARGVLVVVGGPQYRAGSHRQFTLLARDLAADGVPAMRFDYRGMGDSEGDMRDFEAVADDLRAAVDAFVAAVPGLRDVVLWGLCDGASAIAMHAATDARVAGVVLLNPWVRSEEGIARATLKHYYRARLVDPAFWRKLLGGRFDVAGSVKSMLGLARAARERPVAPTTAPFPLRMRAGLRAFGGPVLVITSGADLTAREFCDLAGADKEWKRLLAAPRVTRRELDKADHTFSRRAWRDQVSRWTREWLRSW